MPQKQPAPDTADQAIPTTTTADSGVYEPTTEQEWIEEPLELPRRPRRRLLGVSGNPLPLALFGVLLLACGFIGGVLVEKGQSSSSRPTSGTGALASRLAALRGGSAGGTGTERGATAGASSSGGGFFGGGRAPAGVGATVGQVSFVSGHTLYVTSAEGNTVKVTTSAGSTVTKTVTSTVKDIHPGETVVVTGSAGNSGAIAAESIRVSEAGALGGGLGGLFGRGGSGGGGGRGGGGGEPALFGG